ncbi:MAG: hypothetical protein HY859_16720 [Caulobacterales bacterium]|nr:hypothetical protein [Caulobacterales bacterium]
MTDAEHREYLCEWVRCHPRFLSHRPSRLRIMFAALTLQDAIGFGNDILPQTAEAFPIFEVFSDKFCTLDMNWLDYASSAEQKEANYTSYWWGEISNHNPVEGVRRPPRLEVLISLPATVGEIVAWSDGRVID